MDNLSPLVKKVMDKANEEAEAILREAQAETAEIARKAAEEAADKAGAIRAKAEANGLEQVRRAQVQASMAIQNAILAEKGKCMDEILSELPSKLRSLNDRDYANMLRGFVLSSAPLGLVTVLPAEKDKDILDSTFVKGLNEVLQAKGQETTLILTGEVADIDGGLLLIGENVSVNCSLSSICSYFKDELEPIIADALFSDDQNR